MNVTNTNFENASVNYIRKLSHLTKTKIFLRTISTSKQCKQFFNLNLMNYSKYQ